MGKSRTMALKSAGYTTLRVLAEKNDGKQSVAVPMRTVKQLLDAYETMLDIVALHEAKRRGGEYFPKELVDRLIAGESHVRVYREYRELTQQALAKASGVSRDMIAMIETDRKRGSVATLKKLAQALDVDLEDIA